MCLAVEGLLSESPPRDGVFVNLHQAQQGLGSASCGPGVLPWYRLDVRETTFEMVLRAV